MPPLEFSYTEAVVDPQIHFVDPKSLEDMPVGLDNHKYQWVDLDSVGLSGILSEVEDAWNYKRNLGNGQFAPPERIGMKPAFSQVESGQQKLMDLAAEGEVFLVQLSSGGAGFYERDEEGEWGPFNTFVSHPNIDWNDANLRFIDLDGDGRSDILITEHEVF